jgi:hypothetical protein
MSTEIMIKQFDATPVNAKISDFSIDEPLANEPERGSEVAICSE